MPDEDLELREAVEESRGEETKDVQSRLRKPAPTVRAECSSYVLGIVSLVVLEHGIRSECWMQINGNVQLLRFLKHGPEMLVVVETAIEMVIDQCSYETEFLDTASQFFGCGFGFGDGEHGKAY